MTTFIVIVVLIIGFIALGMYGKMEADKKRKLLEDAGYNPDEFIDSGKLLTGHPAVDTSKQFTYMYIKDGVINIHEKINAQSEIIIPHFASIPCDKIKDVVIEDATTIEKRITATRLLAVGIFAFALKKKQKNELAYLTIKWNDGKFDHETIFEFSGTSAAELGNAARNKIIRKMQ